MAKKSVVETHVTCYTCQTQIPQSDAEQLAGEWFCKADCKKPASASAAKATAKAKAAKAPKAKAPKKPPVVISYKVLKYTPAEGEKSPPRQLQVILATIKRLAGKKKNGVLKSDLVAELEANNNCVTANSTQQDINVEATFTHDLRCKQPALHVLMHYQKRAINEGRIELIK